MLLFQPVFYWYGETNDFTRKGGVLHTEVMLPPNAPRSYSDRQTLRNAVEKAEKNKKAQLAYSFDIALQNELTMDENIALARRFVQDHFVSKGMIADFAVHEPDKENCIPNPHFHVMTTMRPLNPDGTRGGRKSMELRKSIFPAGKKNRPSSIRKKKNGLLSIIRFGKSWIRC